MSTYSQSRFSSSNVHPTKYATKVSWCRNIFTHGIFFFSRGKYERAVGCSHPMTLSHLPWDKRELPQLNKFLHGFIGSTSFIKYFVLKKEVGAKTKLGIHTTIWSTRSQLLVYTKHMKIHAKTIINFLIPLS